MVKNPPTKEETKVQSLGWGRSPAGGNDNPLQNSCLGNLMDRGAWRATVHGVTKSQETTWQLNNDDSPADSLCCAVDTQHSKATILQKIFNKDHRYLCKKIKIHPYPDLRKSTTGHPGDPTVTLQAPVKLNGLQQPASWQKSRHSPSRPQLTGLLVADLLWFNLRPEATAPSTCVSARSTAKCELW